MVALVEVLAVPVIALAAILLIVAAVRRARVGR
jgi:hypothetical protein